jgi:hypothetical protein
MNRRSCRRCIDCPAARLAEPDPREFLRHPGADDLNGGGWPQHHLEFGDQTLLVEGEFVDPFHVLAIDFGRELEHGHAGLRILELVQVAELAAVNQLPLGRLQHFHHLIAPLYAV